MANNVHNLVILPLKAKDFILQPLLPLITTLCAFPHAAPVSWGKFHRFAEVAPQPSRPTCFRFLSSLRRYKNCPYRCDTLACTRAQSVMLKCHSEVHCLTIPFLVPNKHGNWMCSQMLSLMPHFVCLTLLYCLIPDLCLDFTICPSTAITTLHW